MTHIWPHSTQPNPTHGSSQPMAMFAFTPLYMTEQIENGFDKNLGDFIFLKPENLKVQYLVLRAFLFLGEI